MKNINIPFDYLKKMDEFTLADLECLYDDLYDALYLLGTVSSSFVENEEDLIQFTVDAGFSSVYSCALDLLSSYGYDSGKAVLLNKIGFISADDLELYLNVINSSITFLNQFILSSAIWKEV